MTQKKSIDRSVEVLKAIWLSFNTDEERHYFIEEETTAREVYRLDQAGLLTWTEVLEH